MKKYTAKELRSPASRYLLHEIVDVLTRSFVEDASHKWLLGKSSSRDLLQVLPDYMRFIVFLALSCDAITRVVFEDDNQMDRIESSEPVKSSPRVRGVAIAIPPHGNAAFDSFLNSLRAGALTLVYKCGVGLGWRLITTWLPMLESVHRRIFPDTATKYHNWYLFYIVVSPEYQGQGLGKMMVEDLQEEIRQFNRTEHEKAHADGRQYTAAPMCLEASGLRSKRLYNRLGFEDVCTGSYGINKGDEEVNLAEDGTVLGGLQYGMIWKP